jgi:hypothetical protein
MYKTLFFALMTTVLWIGSLILAFFGGAIAMVIFTDNNEKEQHHDPRPPRDPTKVST